MQICVRTAKVFVSEVGHKQSFQIPVYLGVYTHTPPKGGSVKKVVSQRQVEALEGMTI